MLFLTPADQKCGESSTFWQFCYYRPPGNFLYTAREITKMWCQELDLYLYIERYDPLDNQYGFSISVQPDIHCTTFCRNIWKKNGRTCFVRLCDVSCLTMPMNLEMTSGVTPVTVTYTQWFHRVKFVVIPPCFVWQQYLWNIAIKRTVGCYNSWANVQCSGRSPLGEKLLWNRFIGVSWHCNWYCYVTMCNVLLFIVK